MLVEIVPWDHPDAVELRNQQRAEIAERYQTPDSEPGIAPSASDITVFMIVRTADGAAIGCGGLRRLDAVSGEVKRMYVRPQNRGSGAADAVLGALHEYARQASWTHLRLETGDRQPDAIAFYRRHGYQRIENFGAYVGVAESLCFELTLS